MGSARPVLDEDEGRQGQRREDTQPDDERRAPGIGRAAEGREQHQGREADAEQDRAEVVDAVPLAFTDAGQRHGEHRERHHPQRDVDVEDPAPARVAGEESADQRPRDAGHAEHGPEQPHVAAALPRRDDVPDRRLGAYHQAAAAQTLDRPEGDQLGHSLGLPAQPRADQEEHQRPLEHDLAAVEIAELAVQRGDDRDRQQVGGDDPGEVVEPAEVADDRRQRGRDDRLIERRQQHRQHQRPDDDQHTAPRWRFRGLWRSSHPEERTERP